MAMPRSEKVDERMEERDQLMEREFAELRKRNQEEIDR